MYGFVSSFSKVGLLCTLMSNMFSSSLVFVTPSIRNCTLTLISSSLVPGLLCVDNHKLFFTNSPQYKNTNIANSFEFFTIRFSVRLSDRFKVTQNKINFIKNCLQWGLNSQPLDHKSTALQTVLSHYLVVGVNH